MNVLISGVGIAGPTLAFWLEKYGFCADAGRERTCFAG